MTAKIMLVEDDANLSDIYKARFEAEGFQVTTAKDGEEALALAVKEKPNLIISDIMMPKISGFDMLDILRSTEGINYTKVIMMTALGQAEDKARAEKLGADRYLVKSQVTLEDVVKAVHEVLGDNSTPSVPPPADKPAPATPPTGSANTAPVSLVSPPAAPPANDLKLSSAATDDPPVAPTNPSNTPTISIDPSGQILSLDQTAGPAEPPAPPASGSTTDNQTAALSKIRDFVNKEEADSQAKADNTKVLMANDITKVPTSSVKPTGQDQPVTQNREPTNDHVSIVNKKVIKPLNDIRPNKASLEKALALEEAKEELAPPPVVHGSGINSPAAQNQVDQGHLTL